MCFPSGLTSRFIHVPSDVVNSRDSPGHSFHISSPVTDHFSVQCLVSSSDFAVTAVVAVADVEPFCAFRGESPVTNSSRRVVPMNRFIKVIFGLIKSHVSGKFLKKVGT